LGGAKKIPTVGVFPTVSVFSYGQIKPTVKMPRLRCTQFVVPPSKIYIINVLSPAWSRSCKHFVAKLGTAGIFFREVERNRERERADNKNHGHRRDAQLVQNKSLFGET
jgi:hypothetical protein